ncbi:MAG: hypothetical protein IJT46_04285 [Bacteroidaceae bacterium]|nr:hypothetical protein [Bacteroidaceae bacterium]
MFRKRGVFSLATGQWILNTSFEPLNLLGNTWLTRHSGFFQMSEGYYPLFTDPTTNNLPTVETSAFDTSGFNSNDNYMLIIPNALQKSLAVNLSYVIKNGSSYENVDISKTIENLKIEPGKYYQILLTLDRKELQFSVSIDGDWEAYSPQPSVGI